MTLTPISKRAVQLTPVFKSADPEFNHEAAKRAYEMVMKMDSDEAFMFTHLLMGDVLDADIEANRRTLQTRIDQVVKKRIDRVKKALAVSISKGHSEEAEEFAKALVTLEKAWKNPYETGAYDFKESDFRRGPGGRFTNKPDPTTGLFRTKIRVNPNMQPLSDKQAKNLGIPISGEHYQKKLSPQQKAEFQQEWMQIANFLNAATEGGGQLGNKNIQLHISSPEGSYARTINGRPRLGIDWDPQQGERVVGVTATPATLTLGGAAFGLTNALGAPISGSAAGAINRADTGFGDFAEDFTKPVGNGQNSNERLYNRVTHGAKFVSEVAPDTATKTQLAARFARAVGEHGPQAEKILGPGTRKLTYRYRGTEKTPDSEAVRQYEMVTGRAKAAGRLTPEQSKSLESLQRRALTRYRKEKAAKTNTPEEAVRLNADEIAEHRRFVERRWREDNNLVPSETPVQMSPEARGAGREVLARYLMDKERAPKKDLYNLQLESGNTPASTGFIIDKDGKVVTQAQGFGDDHYVPFNLKHLKGLKGGEYIRTRSVGGPTAEDIYTGLAAGASAVTVVSRSGYFTVEFNPETTKGRFNDKARRMVRRYENIIDAVQSEQVPRPQRVSSDVRGYFARQVEEAYPGATPRQRRLYTNKMVEEYKNELQMTTGDEEDFNAYLEEISVGMRDEEKSRLRGQMHNDWKAHNEFWFKLNGKGYEDGLKALEEQFPYYINVRSGPLKEMEEISTEPDKGYVEPGRNRPTEARAGHYGTAVRLGDKGNKPLGASKFSASRADYQGYRGTGGPRDTTAEDAGVPPKPPGEGAAGAAATGTPTPTPTPAQGALEQAREEATKEISRQSRVAELNQVQDAGVALTRALSSGLNWGGTRTNPDGTTTILTQQQGLERASKVFPPLAMTTDDQIREYFSNPEKVREAQGALRNLNVDTTKIGADLKQAMANYAQATGHLNRVDFDPKLAFTVTEHPFRFTEAPYLTGADPSLAENEARRLDTKFKSVMVTDNTLSGMDDEDLERELNTLIRIHRALDDINSRYEADDLPGRTRELQNLRVNTSIPGVMQILERGNLNEHAEAVQRMRALNLNRGTRTAATQYGLPPALERTVHLEAPPPGNKEKAQGHAMVLTNAINRLTKNLDWVDDGDNPRIIAAQELGKHAQRMKELSTAAEVPNEALANYEAQAQDALVLAEAVNSGVGDMNENVRRYLDSSQL